MAHVSQDMFISLIIIIRLNTFASRESKTTRTNQHAEDFSVEFLQRLRPLLKERVAVISAQGQL